ncbi:MAG: hypothetical protein R6V35_00575 [Candidatus Nanohaloarchaea archaeon]
MDLSMSSLSKGQAFAPDFLVSVTVFGVMISVFLLSWNSMIDTQVSGFEDREQYQQGQRAVTQMITDSTEDWDDPEKLGLSTRPYVLNQSSIQEFQVLNHSQQVSLLQTQNFSLSIESRSQSYEMGYEPNGDSAVPFRREVLLRNNNTLERAEVRYISWR